MRLALYDKYLVFEGLIDVDETIGNLNRIKIPILHKSEVQAYDSSAEQELHIEEYREYERVDLTIIPRIVAFREVD